MKFGPTTSKRSCIPVTPFSNYGNYALSYIVIEIEEQIVYVKCHHESCLFDERVPQGTSSTKTWTDRAQGKKRSRIISNVQCHDIHCLMPRLFRIHLISRLQDTRTFVQAIKQLLFITFEKIVSETWIDCSRIYFRTFFEDWLHVSAFSDI